MRGIAELHHAETQAVEGINSIVKLIGKRCPNISLELMSSRLVIKRHLSQSDGNLGCSKKWSNIKKHAESTVNTLKPYSTAALAIMGDAQRWAVADAVPLSACGACPPEALCEGIRTTDLESIATVVASAGLPGLPALLASAPSEPSSRAVVDCRLGHAGPGPAGSTSGVFGQLSPAKIKWAKECNLRWKRFTLPNKRQMKKIADDKRLPKATLHIAVLSVADQHQFCLVVEKFAHSVQFAGLKQHMVNATAYVKWEFNPNNCVESTLFFMSFYDSCASDHRTIPVGVATLDFELAEALFSQEGVAVESILMSVQDVLVLQCSEEPPKKRGRPPKPKYAESDAVKTSREKKRSALALADGGDDHDSPSQSSSSESGETDRYLDDELHWEDESSIASDASRVDDSDDDAAANTFAEIQSAHDLGKALPSDDSVLEKVEELLASNPEADVVPEAELQEEALLLLLRQSTEDKK